MLIDAEELSAEQASRKLERFIEDHTVAVLNVAGPRSSGEPKAYAYAKRVILNVLET